MLMTKNRSSPATPVRVRSPHSMMIAASNWPSALGATRMSGTPGNCISGGGAASDMTTSASLPIARSAYAIASDDPIESPSGRACDEMTKRRRSRIAAAIRSTAAGSGLAIVVGVIGRRGGRGRSGSVRSVELAQQALDPVLARDRFVVEELELGSPPQTQCRADAASEERRRAVEGLRGVLPRLVIAQAAGRRPDRRVVDACELQVRRHLDARQRNEPDPRVVHFAGDEQCELAADLIGDAVGSGALRHLCDDLHALVLEHLDHVADLDVVELFEADAALESRFHFADVVLEPAQRSDLAFVNDDVVAQQARLGVARSGDPSLGDMAARDRSELRDLERIAHFRDADPDFLERRIEE